MSEQCLGIDWGTKRIGLALGNSETKLASPWGFVASLADLLTVVKKEKIDRLVLGIPYRASGDQEGLNSEFKAFLEALEAQSDMPITQIDERFSSQLADTLTGGYSGKGERDAVAAMVILQTYFDSLEK